jgi:hypothetical protein
MGKFLRSAIGHVGTAALLVGATLLVVALYQGETIPIGRLMSIIINFAKPDPCDELQRALTELKEKALPVTSSVINVTIDDLEPGGKVVAGQPSGSWATDYG